MGMGRAAKETEDVGSAMIQSATDCGNKFSLAKDNEARF